MRETNSFISSPHLLRLYLAAARHVCRFCVRPREILMHRQTEMTCRCAEGDFTRKVIIKTYPPLRGCMRWCRCILSVLPVLPPRHAAVRSRRRGRHAPMHALSSALAVLLHLGAGLQDPARFLAMLASLPSSQATFLYTPPWSPDPSPPPPPSPFSPKSSKLKAPLGCFGSSLPFGRPGTHARASGALCSSASASQAPVAAYEAAVVVCQGRSF